MSDSSPWVPVYAADLIAATHDWPPAAQGVYFSLLIHQSDRGALPNDWGRRLRAMVNGFLLSDEEWGEVVALVAPKFEVGEDGALRNPRMAEVMAERNAIRQSKVEAAKKRERAKRSKVQAQKPVSVLASTTTTTNDSRESSKGAEAPEETTTTRQLELSVGMVAVPAPPPERQAVRGDVEGLGQRLLEAMGLKPRALSQAERELLESKAGMLTAENVDALAAWYPKGRRRRRRKADALIYFLTDLEACLDHATAPTRPGRGESSLARSNDDAEKAPPPGFLEWLQEAELGALASVRQSPRDAWRLGPVREQWRREAA